MKFFKNKNAMTLVELIISVTVSTVVILIVMTFMTNSLNELRVTNETTRAIDTMFSLKNNINRYVKSGYNHFDVYSNTGENSVVLLQNGDGSEGALFGIVNEQTRKIQKQKIYGDNFYGFRKISQKELGDILVDSGVIYNYDFFDDKIFKGVRVKDFDAKLYNIGDILDIYSSIILVNDENNFGKNISDLFFDKNDILDFSLDF